MENARLRWGALAWLLTLQFFAVETIAQLRFDGPYSRVDDVISDLGAGSSPAAPLMNASFVLQAVLIAAGALLLRSALPRPGGPTTVLLAIAGAGVLVVGVVPLDAHGRVHAAGAVAYLIGGSVGLLALAQAVRPRSELLGSLLALLGVVATSMSVFFLTGVTRYLGEGGTERAAAYLLPIGLALAGGWLWRLGRAPVDAGSDAGSDGDADADADAPEDGPEDGSADGEEDHWAPSGRQQD